jgi:hypothetical protein
MQAMSVSQAYVSLNPGTFVEVAKVYLKFDDRDTLVSAPDGYHTASQEPQAWTNTAGC